MTARIQEAGSILVVEDNADIRLMVTRILTRAGYTVTQACDGADAISEMNARRFDAIVLDMMMPRVNGHQVLAYMREHHHRGRCVVISSAAVHTLSPADAALVAAMIHKPFDLATLLTAVRGCLESD